MALCCVRILCVGGGVQSASKYWRPRDCVGSGPVRKYENGLGTRIGDGVITRIKTGTQLQQLDYTEETQKPFSQIGFENWV